MGRRPTGYRPGTRGGSHAAITAARTAQVVTRHGLQTKGFHRALEAAILADLEAEYFMEEPGDLLPRFRQFRPDAYRIDAAEKLVECWEIVIGSAPLAECYADGALILDEIGWSLLLLFVEGRTGALVAIDPIVTAAMQQAGRIVPGSFVLLDGGDLLAAPGCVKGVPSPSAQGLAEPRP